MTLISLEYIRENGHNVRRTPASAENDAQLEHSIRALGVLQPVLLRMDEEMADDGGHAYIVVAGHRRVRAAVAANLTEIPAEILPRLSDAMYSAMQVAENVVRAPMDPVDQWRAIVALQDSGYTLKQAGDALGLSERRTRQLDKLGHIAPEILDLLIGQPLLDMNDIATIAAAPVERQREALQRSNDDYDFVDRLGEIAADCRTERLPRSLAIFDVETAGVLFEEDMFAQPGSDEQFMTSDVSRFIAAQKAALNERIAARSKKERVELGNFDRWGQSLALPKGLERFHGTAPKTFPRKGHKVLFTAVAEAGYYLGKVVEAIGVDTAASAKKAGTKSEPETDIESDDGAELDEGDGNTTDDDGEYEVLAPAEPDFADALSKAGKQLLADKKTVALRERLATAHASGQPLQLGILCAALIVALGGENVDINGSASRYGRSVRFDDLIAQIVGPAGEFMILKEDLLAQLAAQALARMLRVTDPVTGAGSGDRAEWIGAAIGADSALPRFDTPDFLACMSKAALTELAAENGRTGLKTAAGIREALAGSLPDWRPTSFGAPGPSVLFALADAEQDDAA